MKQGTLSLSIEVFELNELFELLRKGSRAFEMKQLDLEVDAYRCLREGRQGIDSLYDKYIGRKCT